MTQMNPQPQQSASQPTGAVTDDDKLWALLNWIFAPIVPVILLLLEDKKDRPFIKHNAYPALILSVVGYVISAVLAPVCIGGFIALALVIYEVVLGIQAYQGNWVTVPVVTDFCKNQGWID
jgi:uncharacterized membrane protein